MLGLCCELVVGDCLWVVVWVGVGVDVWCGFVEMVGWCCL